MINEKPLTSLIDQTAQYVQACGKRSILECKPQISERIKLPSLRVAPVCDTFVSNTIDSNMPKLTLKIAPLTRVGSHWKDFAKTIEGKLVGEYNCYIPTDCLQLRSVSDFPKSWIDSKTGLPKKSLYISYLNTLLAEHQGYGREMMKRFYFKSLECGCEGRIFVDSAWNSGGFYEKLGFEVSAEQLAEYEKCLKEAKAELKRIERKSAGQQRNEWQEEYKEHLLEEIEAYSKMLKNPFETGNGGVLPLYFTPTPGNVAKLFSK